jgi:hypothetical protein
LGKHTRASLEHVKAKHATWFDEWLKDFDAYQARICAQRDAVLRGLDAEPAAVAPEQIPVTPAAEEDRRAQVEKRHAAPARLP